MATLSRNKFKKIISMPITVCPFATFLLPWFEIEITTYRMMTVIFQQPSELNPPLRAIYGHPSHSYSPLLSTIDTLTLASLLPQWARLRVCMFWSFHAVFELIEYFLCIWNTFVRVKVYSAKWLTEVFRANYGFHLGNLDLGNFSHGTSTFDTYVA